MLKPIAVLMFQGLLFSQVATAPTFEAASVKRNNSAGGRSEFRMSPDGVTITNTG